MIRLAMHPAFQWIVDFQCPPIRSSDPLRWPWEGWIDFPIWRLRRGEVYPQEMLKKKDKTKGSFCIQFFLGGWVVILRIYSVNIVRIPSWKNTVQCNNLEERGANEHEIYPEYFGSWVYPCLKRQAANEVVMISFWDSSPHWKITTTHLEKKT